MIRRGGTGGRAGPPSADPAARRRRPRRSPTRTSPRPPGTGCGTPRAPGRGRIPAPSGPPRSSRSARSRAECGRYAVIPSPNSYATRFISCRSSVGRLREGCGRRSALIREAIAEVISHITADAVRWRRCPRSRGSRPPANTPTSSATVPPTVATRVRRQEVLRRHHPRYDRLRGGEEEAVHGDHPQGAGVEEEGVAVRAEEDEEHRRGSQQGGDDHDPPARPAVDEDSGERTDQRVGDDRDGRGHARTLTRWSLSRARKRARRRAPPERTRPRSG